MRHFLILFALFALTLPAKATFVRSVMDRVDTESLFDSEYFHDLRSFAWPRAWDEPWAASSGGFRVNGASLDCCDLYLDQGLLFNRRVAKGLDFRFRYVELSDKDRQESHHWLELEQDLGGGWSAELFGEPTYRKEDSDIGAGLRWKSNHWQVRLRRTMVDFNFNQRGSTTQRYSLKPWTNEFFVHVPAGAWALRLAAELDEATRREIPDERRSFFYRRTRGWIGLGKESGWAPHLRYSYETQTKINTVAPGGTGTTEEARRHVHEVLASARIRPSSWSQDELEPGTAFLIRSSQSQQPNVAATTLYKRWEIQPYVRWRHRINHWLTSELTPSLSIGENRQRHLGRSVPARYETITEAKLGTAMEFDLSPSGKIALGGVFDLDTPGKPWDGGNIRAMFLF